MPELPEVENIRVQLEKFITGHVVQKISISNEKSFQGNPAKIIGGKIMQIRRFGKLLTIDLNNKFSMAVHVKMTGQLIYRGVNLNQPPGLSEKVKGGLDGKHTHVVFFLDRDSKLFFIDVRKFGWIKVVKTADVSNLDFVKKLGPEPRTTNNPSVQVLTLDNFARIVSSSARPIKILLMDQSKISGVGNIYANDALWLAKIHPGTKASKLSDEEIKRLFNAVEEVLKKGLKTGGSSQNSFVRPDGTTGEYQQQFIVYGRAGEPCKRCKSKIEKIKLGGRGTFFCPKCQR